ncbi:hypothetical protein ECPA39_5028, partial [Escherichia coli PA39]
MFPYKLYHSAFGLRIKRV